MAAAPAATQTAPRSQPAQPANGAKQQPSAAEQDKALLQSILDKEVEYKPFLSDTPIRLSARMVRRFLCKPTKSGKLCDENQALRFVMLCKSRGLNPWEGDAFIVGYDGQDGPDFNLVTALQAFLKRAEVHPEYDGMESGVIVARKHPDNAIETVELQGDYFDPGETLVGGWARVHLKHRKVPVYRRLKLQTFNKGFSRWKIDPAGMIVKCAEADALRSAFPNSLGGMYLDDEMPEIVGAAEKAEVPALAPGRSSLRRPAEPANGLAAQDAAGESGPPYAGDEAHQQQPAPPDDAAQLASSEQHADINQLLADGRVVVRHWEDDFKRRHGGRSPADMTAAEADDEAARLRAKAAAGDTRE